MTMLSTKPESASILLLEIAVDLQGPLAGQDVRCPLSRVAMAAKLAWGDIPSAVLVQIYHCL